MPCISTEHYEQGRALYEAGHDLRELMENGAAMESRSHAEHEAVEAGFDPNVAKPGDREERHRAVSERYDGAEQSLILGFADSFLADIRRAVTLRGRR